LRHFEAGAQLAFGSLAGFVELPGGRLSAIGADGL